MSSRIIPVQPFDYVVFGATGDLTKRKLIPALYHRFKDGQFDEQSRIIGVSRTKWSDADFQKAARDDIAQFVDKEDQDEAIIDRFVSIFAYVPNDVTDPAITDPAPPDAEHLNYEQVLAAVDRLTDLDRARLAYIARLRGDGILADAVHETVGNGAPERIDGAVQLFEFQVDGCHRTLQKCIAGQRAGCEPRSVKRDGAG